MKIKFVILSLSGLAIILIVFSYCRSSQEAISYNDDIRPIINAKCIACHGGVKKSGDLSFLFREEAITTGASGEPSIVPGKPHQSEVIKRLTHDNPELRMPLEHPALSESEIDLLSKWIRQGAEWETHWAYTPIQEPALPEQFDPWVQNPIDHFVLNKLHEKNWTPSQPADAPVLLRRLFLDITGLPPSESDYNQYLTNESIPIDQVLNQLLNDSAYGEKWASFWLDLARYADSQGYEKDPYRNIWKYREWVINAFNQDMPFDQFTIEQLAGDLLNNPTEDQLIATAFHRNTMTNTEGGTDDEEFRVAAMIDRVNTTFEVWQATTMSCVQCHSHPYDPFRHQEFYEFMGILNSTKDNDLNTEFPLLETYNDPYLSQIKDQIETIHTLQNTTWDTTVLVADQIKQALFPTIYMHDADDLFNAILYGNGILTNWGNNVNDAIDRKFYFRLADIPMNQLESVTYTYKAETDAVRMDIFIDSIGGPQISTTHLPAVPPDQDDLSQHTANIETSSGRHDLIFEIVNTIGQVPEGIAYLQKIEFNYGDVHVNANIQKAKDQLYELRQNATFTPIMRERAEAFARKNYVFERGNYLVEGEEVRPGVPDILQVDKSQTNMDRMDMAQWLVSENNPLTARVLVNRVWEQLFGKGLVETLEDFGTMSAAPAHPELLDYLAYTFMHKHQWSIKSLIREITSSSTYQQSSASDAQGFQQDPDNTYLGRGPRFRLSGEQVRDQALAISGLLYEKIGGPSVMPPQPDGIWQVVYSGEQWIPEEGKNKYRRAIYTLWKRTSPYPSLIAFDNPSREFCVSRRIRTNTPLQALVTLNDPVYLDLANGLAKRLQQTYPDQPEEQIKYGLYLATGNRNHPGVENLMNLFEEAKMDYEIPKTKLISNPQDSETTLSEPMAIVANAILNLDQVLTKE